MVDLTPEQEKAVIEAFSKPPVGWVDAWDNASEWERQMAVQLFLAGVRWAQREKGDIMREAQRD
jgi:hypothetical protein